MKTKKVYFVAVRLPSFKKPRAEIYVFESKDEARTAMVAFSVAGYDAAITELKEGMPAQKRRK